MKYVQVIWKRVFTILLSLFMVFSLVACGGGNANGDKGAGTSSESAQSESTQLESAQSESAQQESTQSESVQSDSTQTDSTQTSASDGSDSDAQAQEDEAGADAEETDGADGAGSKILVVYFSHTGENHNVGVIEKGNTHIIADMIAEETGADLFEIETVNPYPDAYNECTDVAKQEQNENARPEIVNPPENLDGYDTVFIGYPIWWGDLPMAVYTFLENYDFSGKTVIPFCTHEGSGLSGTESSIAETCSGATVLDGLAIRGSVAQNEQDEAKADVTEWLDGLGI